MPQPPTTGGSGLSRSEAAILAWKKRTRAAPKPGALDPKIAARVKEILAAKQKKPKAKAAPKGKAAPKPKPKPTDAEKQALADQKKLEKDTAAAAERGKNLTKVGEDTDLGDNLADMDKFKRGKGIKERDAVALEKRGLVERAADGTPRLSSAGNAVLAAAARGDSQGAKDAASRGADAVAKRAEHDKAKAEKVTAAQAKQAATLAKQKQAAGKAKAGKKEAAKPAAPAKQSENRAKVAKDMADQDAGLSPSGSAALGDFADGKPLDDKVGAQFEAMGLTERGSDGAHRLTSEGRAAAAAMSKGDTRGAIDAISRAADKKKQGEDTVNAKNKAANERATAQAAKDKAAADKKQPKETKAMPDTYAIKQDAEERAMFAAMDEKGTRKTPKGSGGGKAKGGGGGGSSGKTIPHGPKGKEAGFGKPATYSGRREMSFGHAGDSSNYGNHDPIGFVREHHKGSGTYNVEKGGGHGGTGHPEALATNLTLSEARHAAHLVARHTHSTANTAYGASHKLNTETLKQDSDYTALIGKIRARRESNNAGKAIDMSDDTLFTLDDLLAIKAGARHSRTDMQHLQGIHDSSVACGAACGPESDDSGESDAEGDDAVTDAIKSIMDDPRYYAQHECGDVMQACSALQTLCMLIQSELGEDDEDPADVSQLCDAADILVTFIGSELDELRGAAKEDAGTIGHQPMKGIEIETLDDGEEIATVSGSSVKALSEPGMVGGYLVKFGGEGDLSQWRDVFTKNTNFGKHTKTDVWVHHRMLPGLGKQQLTNQAELSMDDEGVFMKHLFDLRKSYEAKLYGMVQMNKLGLSSGTAPHLVERKALGDGRHEITQWILGLDASYTPTPAGGMGVNAGAIKTAFLAELGLEGIDTNDQEAITPELARADGLKASDERARRLLLQAQRLRIQE